MNRIIRLLGILALGVIVVLAASLFLCSVQRASATIYWHDARALDNYFFDGLNSLGLEPFFGGPVVLNGCSGHFVVFRASTDVLDSLGQLKTQFSAACPNDISVGTGDKAGFFVAKNGERTFAAMLIRDDNKQKTWLFTLTMPTELFYRTTRDFVDEDGIDPVPEFRPPASTRKLSFQTSALAFAAYKNMGPGLDAFYDNACAASMTSQAIVHKGSTQTDSGGMFFFNGIKGKGFVLHKYLPECNTSYSIVCAEGQQ
jgi:hypothetical protein